MEKKVFWFDGRDLKRQDVILELVANKSFENLVISFDMVEKVKPQNKMQIIVEVKNKGQINDKLSGKVILARDLKLLAYAQEKGFKTAYLTDITSKEDMDNAWMHGAKHNHLVLDFKDATNIPLELILAKTQNSETSVIKQVETLQDADIAFGVMEKGSDGVLLKTEDIDEIVKVDEYIMMEKQTKITLSCAKVIEVKHIGMGKRVCIDTVDLLNKNEGMVVGSTSNGGLLISSETHFLPYMDLRPFRVNAGAIHSYVWGADNMSPYLSDLKAGSKLLAVDIKGNAREVTVGRIKIETRPLLLIKAKVNEQEINSIVQDDWHIRIFGSKGEVRNGSEIKPGDELMGYICASGRHVGIKINESLDEK